MKLLTKDQFEDHWFELGVQDEYEAEFGDLITVEEIRKQPSTNKENAFVEAVWQRAFNKYVKGIIK